MDRIITDKRLRKELDKRGYNTIQLVKGDGYFYWVDEDENDTHNLLLADSTSVYLCHYNQQTYLQWVDELEQLIKSIEAI